MPNIDLSILNQRQTPAFYADTLANRPAAGFVGRIFVSTDTFAFYRDNGTTWDLIGGPGTGTVTGTGAAGQVTYWNGASTITGDNNLFYDTVNSRLGVNTNTPTNAFDVHSSVSPIAGFNQTTATNNSLLVLLNSGTALWRIGSFYNAGANDFGVFDVVGAIQPVTIKKTTGQVLIGTSTVGGGKLVVSSATADNGVQIVGASAPSLRLDDAVTGATKRAGLGISTAVNNFIQGSADRDFCIFNGSTTASPILFGVYNGTNIQEAARISTARNLLVGSTTDTGDKIQSSGSINIASTFFFRYNGDTGLIGSATSIGGTAAQLGIRAASDILFATNGANERMRITSGGTLQVNGGDILGGNTSSDYGALTLRGGYAITTASAAKIEIRGYEGGGTTQGAIMLYTNNTMRVKVYQGGIVNLSNVPIYASNALALAGGLVAGDIYKSATGALSIVY